MAWITSDSGAPHFAELDMYQVVSASGTGIYRLTFRLKVSPNSKQPDGIANVIWLSADLYCPSSRTGKIVARSHCADPFDIRPDSNWTTVDIHFDLTPLQIDALEHIRAGGGLNCELVFHGAVFQNQRFVQLRRESFNYHCEQSAWIKLLDSMQYRKTMLIEVPLLSGATDPRWEEAVSQLAAADNQFRLGHYRETVAGCRKVIEVLELVGGTDNGGKESRQRTKSQRIVEMRNTFKALTHLASHHGDDISITTSWGMVDAQAALTLTSTFYRLSVEAANNQD